MKILFLITLFVNLFWLVYLWKIILRTKRTLRHSEEKLKELTQQTAMLNALYHDDVQVMMADNLYVRPKRKRMRFIVGLN